jgi:predicted RNA polymerase sigma factor
MDARSCSQTRTGRGGTERRSSAAELERDRGGYGLQAAIAACHALAPSVEETDWDRIVVL